jgi:hypothetical protein
VRAVVLSLLATLVGLAMVGGGIWGLVGSVSDDDDDSSATASSAEPKTSSPADCAQVAERDPRFKLPHDLQFGGSGKATVTCEGETVTFSIELDGLQQSTFYEVILQKRRREADVGTFLFVGSNNVNTVTVGPDVPIEKYDFLVVRPDSFHNPGVDQAPYIAAL